MLGKKILITGSNSYIGNSIEKWLLSSKNSYTVEKISLRNNNWENKNLTEFDCIIHTAGIAHIKETNENKDLYYKVNRDLTYKFADYAKKQGVKDFIFLSTMSVFGIEKGVIGPNSELTPKSHYGKSKLEAEKLLESLGDKSYNIMIVRPPMVYGSDCKGNYQLLSKLARKTKFFPSLENKRSMIFIDNLTMFIDELIQKGSPGIYHPQNEEYISTSELVKEISTIQNNKIYFLRLFNGVIRFFRFIPLLQKVFGDLYYSNSLSSYEEFDYPQVGFKQSILATESDDRLLNIE